MSICFNVNLQNIYLQMFVSAIFVPVNISNCDRDPIWWSQDSESTLRWPDSYLISKSYKKL